MPSQHASIVALFAGSQADALMARLLAINEQLADDADVEFVVVGHGDPEASSDAARDLLRALPQLQLLLHARRCREDDALVAGVRHAIERRVVLLPASADPAEEAAQVAGLLADRRVPLPQGADGPLLIERERFLALPRIRRMRRYLPELLARSRRQEVAGASAERAPRRIRPWLRARWVALLCRLAGPSATYGRLAAAEASD